LKHVADDYYPKFLKVYIFVDCRDTMALWHSSYWSNSKIETSIWQTDNMRSGWRRIWSIKSNRHCIRAELIAKYWKIRKSSR